MKVLDARQRQDADALISHEWPKLERFLRTKVPQSDILEVAQATCLAYLEGQDRVDTSSRAYLWGIARKQVLRYWERHRARGAEPLDSSKHSLQDVGPSLSSALALRSTVLAALQTLPADQQMAIELRYGEGLSLEETAAAIGVSLATIKRYLSVAEGKLRGTVGASADATGVEYKRS